MSFAIGEGEDVVGADAVDEGVCWVGGGVEVVAVLT